MKKVDINTHDLLLCSQCGYPFDIDDIGFVENDENDTDIFCSKSCHHDYMERQEINARYQNGETMYVNNIHVLEQ